MKKQTKKRLIKYLSFILCVCVIVLAGNFFTGQNSEKYKNKDFVSVLDVGQGDSILICSNGYSALIDTGSEITSRQLLRELRGYGVKKLDALIISHSHEDHAGGAEYLLKRMDIANVVISEFQSDESANDLKKAIYSSSAEVFTAEEGMIINVGDFSITVLFADYTDKDINNRSLWLMADIENKKFLFTGDAEKRAEEKLIESGINLDCDVLKVGHHGSSTSSSEEFINIATPEYAVISVGENNSYGLPDKEVIKRLENTGAEVYRTDYVGNIVFFIENGEILREDKNAG